MDTEAVPPVSRRSEMDVATALQAWAMVSRAMLEDRDLEDSLDLIAETAANLTGQAFAAVLLANPGRTQLEVRGAYGLSAGYVERMNTELPLLLHSGAAGREAPAGMAFMTGRPIVTHQDATDRVSQWAGLAEEQGYVSVASAPLGIEGRLLGALNVYSADHTDFSPRQIVLLEALAAEAAAAIQIMEMRATQRETIQELEQSDRVQQALALVALSDEGLDPITATLSDLAALGIAVEECVSGQLLSVAGLLADEQDALERHRMELRSSGDLDGEVSPREDALPSGDGLVCLEPVRLGTEAVAYLWAFSTSELTPVQRRVLERGVLLVALELLKQRDARAAEWRVRGELVDELMTAGPDNEDRLFERARSLGHDLSRPHVPVVFRPDRPSGAEAASTATDSTYGLERVVAITQALARRHVSDPLMGTYAGSVVMLWPSDARPADEVADSIRTYISSRTRTTVSVCAGDESSTLREYTQSIKLILGALRLLQASGSRDRLIRLDELGVFRILLSVEDEELVTETARSVLAPLTDYDASRNASMLHTLTVFMDLEMNVAEAARALHLHPNSLHYRLRRIEELLGLRLRSPQDLVQVSFALAIQKLHPVRHPS